MIEVYCHTSPSGKRYVGYSTHGMAERWRRHVEFARAGSPYLIHRAIRKYGEGAFEHAVLARCVSEDEAKAVEVECIAASGSLAPGGYNATAGGEGIRAACPVVREKLKASFTPERRAAIGALRAELNAGNTYGTANRGKKRTPESRAKMSEKARGNKSHAGCTHSAEVRAKMSAAVRTAYAEGRRMQHTAESREKIGAAHRGKVVSPETRARMSAAQRARHAARRIVTS